MTHIAPSPDVRRRAIRLWLLAVVALMFVTLIVGGATRLTESGLSIVEWKPLTGIVPPISEPTWQAEFDKYKTIPQFRERNATMTLAEFKLIYWWEWVHRALARFVGAAFLLPFFWFLWRGWIDSELRVRLWAIFGLGAALGAVGWWMVSSGLTERVSVSQYRLAFHLTLACAIFAAILWTAARLMPRAPAVAAARIRLSAIGLVVLVLLQIYLGALVAGLRAGLVYNTWPLIDGQVVPEAARLFFQQPLWRNFFENALTVQFDHRMVAYALFLVAVLHVVDVARNADERSALTGAVALACALAVQMCLGILTLLYSVTIDLALAHQGMAMVALTVAVLHAANLVPYNSAVRIGETGRAGDMIELLHRGNVAVLQMAHGKANAMTAEFCQALTTRLEELRPSPASAVVITGTGRIFSAGVDLPRLLEGGAPYIRAFLPALNAMFTAVFSYPKPVVAAINGHAIAGGCVLACACDRRLMAAEPGRIGVTELLVGVPYPAVAMEIMRHATALQYFEDAIFGGATYTPGDGLTRGLVHEVVEPDLLLDRAVAAAQTLAALSPEAFALSKRQTRQPSFERLERDGRRIDDDVTRIWCAHDTLDRINAYVTRTLRKS